MSFIKDRIIIFVANIIYNHLVRLDYEVMVGQLQAGEIDFVCTKPKGERIYVQASYIIADNDITHLHLRRFLIEGLER